MDDKTNTSDANEPKADNKTPAKRLSNPITILSVLILVAGIIAGLLMASNDNRMTGLFVGLGGFLFFIVTYGIAIIIDRLNTLLEYTIVQNNADKNK